MKKESYFYFSSLLFFVAGLLHFWRIINNWDMVLGGYLIPMWLSWVVFITAGLLSYQGFMLRKKK